MAGVALIVGSLFGAAAAAAAWLVLDADIAMCIAIYFLSAFGALLWAIVRSIWVKAVTIG